MLLKGVNKRVIVIKNPESEIFEEAYFIVKSGGMKDSAKRPSKEKEKIKANENEMVIEANRIISDYHNQQRSVTEKNDVIGKINSVSVNNTDIIGKTAKIKKENKPNKLNKASETKKTDINRHAGYLPDGGIFGDVKFFEDMRGDGGCSEKYENFSNESDLNCNPVYDKNYEDKPCGKSSFSFVSSKKTRLKKLAPPPKSFFIGVGFMSAVIILIRLFELIALN